jgi:DNA-binding NarL/FixJ family response regulator
MIAQCNGRVREDARMSDGTSVVQLMIAGNRSLADSLADSFDATDSIEVVGVAYDADRAIDAAAKLQPDAVVIEADQLGEDGVDAVRRIRALEPRPRLVLLAEPGSPSLRSVAADGSADAYVPTRDAASVCQVVLGLLCR